MRRGRGRRGSNPLDCALPMFPYLSPLSICRGMEYGTKGGRRRGRERGDAKEGREGEEKKGRSGRMVERREENLRRREGRSEDKSGKKYIQKFRRMRDEKKEGEGKDGRVE